MINTTNTTVKQRSLLINKNRELNVLDTFFHRLKRTIEILVMISVGAMSLILIVNVISRYVFKSPIIGAEELALFLLVWITFLGASLGLNRKEMVAVTFIIEKFPSRLMKYIQLFIQLCVMIFSILLLYLGTEWLFSSNVLNAKSSSLKISLWIPYVVFPFSMLLMVLFTLENIRDIFREK